MRGAGAPDGIGRAFSDAPGVRIASKSGALDALRSDVGILAKGLLNAR